MADLEHHLGGIQTFSKLMSFFCSSAQKFYKIFFWGRERKLKFFKLVSFFEFIIPKIQQKNKKVPLFRCFSIFFFLRGGGSFFLFLRSTSVSATSLTSLYYKNLMSFNYSYLINHYFNFSCFFLIKSAVIINQVIFSHFTCFIHFTCI